MSLAGNAPAGSVPSPEMTNATIAGLYDGDMNKEAVNGTATGRRRSSVVNVEKGEIYRYNSRNSEVVEGELTILSTEDPWEEDEAGLRETQQFTFRAVFVGCCLGAVIGASK